MAYVLAAGGFALVVLGALLRALTRSKPASGQFVTQNVLMRIRAEYRDTH